MEGIDAAFTADSYQPGALIVGLCKLLYEKGWASGTGGGVSVRQCEDPDLVVVAPSGVQKERLQPQDMFVVRAASGDVVEQPSNPALKPSACTPLFLEAYNQRGAGAVIHSHSLNAVLATLLDPSSSEFVVTELEMIKGIEGHGFFDRLVVPVVENTAHEHELKDRLAQAIQDYPDTKAVLVRRHGVYIWGKDWVQAKTHAECYDYLFEAAVRMKQMGMDPAASSSSAP